MKEHSPQPREKRPRETHWGIVAAITSLIGLALAAVLGASELKKQFFGSNPTTPVYGTEEVRRENLPMASDIEANEFIGTWCSTDQNFTYFRFIVSRDVNTFFIKISSDAGSSEGELLDRDRVMSLRSPFRKNGTLIFDYNSLDGKPLAIVAAMNPNKSQVEAVGISQERSTPTPDRVWHVSRC